jgi:acyl-homoserine-lactone acylase
MNRSERPRLGWAALAATALATTLVACGSDDDSPEYDAQVTRTSFGVPHIQARDEKGLGYGVGYAYAQDNFCVLADFFVTVKGERAKYFGINGAKDGNGSSANNLTSDVYYKYLNTPELVQATWNRQPTEIQDLTRGYAQGFNRYLKEVGTNGLPAECKGQPWVRNISELDLMRLMRRYAVEASGANFIDAIFAAAPPAAPMAADRAKAQGASAVPAVTLPDAGYWRRFRTHLGSNGVALGKDATASGNGLLLANPHFPWTGAFRFYQMHLTIPGKVNVFGASLGGFPGVNIGHNEHVAWTHTVNTSTHFTLYYLQLDPADPTKYIVDGVSKAMTTQDITVDVANGNGGTTPVTHTLYHTQYGPVLTLPGTLDWTTGAAYALADANLLNDRMFQQWWAMDKATSLEAFKSSVETILGIPWVHAIATDVGGRAYYGDITPVPHVTAAKEAACIPTPFKPLVARGIYVLAGNTSQCAWGEDAGTPQKGIFAASSLPSLMRDDYVQNSNDSAWVTHPAALLTGFPSIVSADGYEQGGRTRIGIQQIQARLAGTDGLGGNRFDMAKLQQIAFSNKSFYATNLLADLRTACTGAGVVTLPDTSTLDVAPGCAVIAAWDGTANLNSTGWPLFFAWRNAMNDGGSAYWTVPFSAADPVNTPRGLRVADAAVVTAARQAMGQAMKSLAAEGLDYTKPWGQVQVAVRGNNRIPMHGGSGDEVYNAIYSSAIGDGQFDVNYGSSIVLTVSFEGGKPKSQGFLTFSQSTNPASPYFGDQTQRFSDRNWISYPFTDADVAADAKQTVRLTQ